MGAATAKPSFPADVAPRIRGGGGKERIHILVYLIV